MLAKKIILVILSILLTFTVVPLLLIILVLPLSLIQESAKRIAKKKGWIPLSSHSYAMVTDDIYGEPRANFITVMLVEGPIFEQELRSRIQALVDNKALVPIISFIIEIHPCVSPALLVQI